MSTVGGGDSFEPREIDVRESACRSRGGLRRLLSEAERLGLPRYECVQNEYNLLAREDETSAIPICRERVLGYTAHSLLLRDPYREISSRAASAGGISGGAASRRARRATEPEVLGRVRQLIAQAEALGVSVADLARTWVFSNPDLTAALVAPRCPEQFRMIEEASRATTGRRPSSEDRWSRQLRGTESAALSPSSGEPRWRSGATVPSPAPSFGRQSLSQSPAFGSRHKMVRLCGSYRRGNSDNGGTHDELRAATAQLHVRRA
jgi:hypothetical protein